MIPEFLSADGICPLQSLRKAARIILNYWYLIQEEVSMRLYRIGRMACDDGRTCPQVLRTEDGDLFVQGYIPGPEAASSLDVPEGEAVVRVPRDVLLEAAWAESRRSLREEEFDELFQTFTRSVFRMETLQQYSVPQEEEALRLFRETGQVRHRTVENSSWLALIQQTTGEGKKWQRVHVVQSPLTEYVQYELQSYRDTIAVGFDTRIVDVGDHPELSSVNEDFWLFDVETEAPTLVLMRYDSSGHYIGAEVSDNREALARCRAQRDLALAVSDPALEYMRRLENYAQAAI
ncbi:MAG: DUF6879 family protein [Candidatus Dormibacteraceae bacterium]